MKDASTLPAPTKSLLSSWAFKFTILVAFLLINLIGYVAFSAEIPVSESSQGLEKSSLPTCQIASEGMVADKWKSIRIQIGNAVVAGAETLSDLGNQLKQLVVEHKCLPLPVPCSFASEGMALGSWVKHRILVQDRIAFGGNTTARLFDEFGQLKKIGVCE